MTAPVFESGTRVLVIGPASEPERNRRRVVRARVLTNDEFFDLTERGREAFEVEAKRRHCDTFVLTVQLLPQDEGQEWARGWDTKAAAAFKKKRRVGERITVALDGVPVLATVAYSTDNGLVWHFRGGSRYGGGHVWNKDEDKTWARGWYTAASREFRRVLAGRPRASREFYAPEEDT